MRYIIEEWDGLYCVFRQEGFGMRIVASFDTVEEAAEAIARYKANEEA